MRFFARKGTDPSRSGTRSLASVPFLLRFFEVVEVSGRYLPVNGYDYLILVTRKRCKRSRSIDCGIIEYLCDFFARKGTDTSRSGTRSLASVPFSLRFFEVVKVSGRYLPVNGYLIV